MATYRAGIIGLNLGQSHARGFEQAEGIEVAAVCDIDENRLEEVGDQYDVPGRYTDAETMLQEAALDVESVATPASLHPAMTLLAARYPVKAVISEKPLANSMGEAESMVNACNRAGIKLLCGYQGRHFGAFETARNLIADGAIGNPIVVKVGVEEGGLANQGSHLIDRALYVLGDPDPIWALGQVQRETDRYERGYVCEDLCFGIAAVNGGARIVYDNDIGPHGDLTNRSFVIAGDDGTITLEPDTGLSYGLRLISANRDDCVIPPEKDPLDHMVAQANELVAWLDGRVDGHRQDGNHAIKSQAIMMAIYESARTHTAVDIPMQTKLAPLEAAIRDGSLVVRYPGAYDIRRPFVYPKDDVG